MPRLNQTGATHILLIILLIVGLITAVYLVQTRTNLLPKAAEPKSGSTKAADLVSLGGTELGIQIDPETQSKIPPFYIIQNLGTKWVRMVYHPNIGIPRLPSGDLP